MTHWTERYIGRPYTKGGCWFLLRDVQREQYGRTITIDTMPGSLREIIEQFETHSKGPQWRRIDVPRDGDVALMSQSHHPHHVGTYVQLGREGRILHTIKGQGSAFHPLSAIATARFKILGYYRPASEFAA